MTDIGQSSVKTTCSIIIAHQKLICFLIALLFREGIVSDPSETLWVSSLRNRSWDIGHWFSWTEDPNSCRVLSFMHDAKSGDPEAGSFSPDWSLWSPSFSLCRDFQVVYLLNSGLFELLSTPVQVQKSNSSKTDKKFTLFHPCCNKIGTRKYCNKHKSCA